MEIELVILVPLADGQDVQFSVGQYHMCWAKMMKRPGDNSSVLTGLH